MTRQCARPDCTRVWAGGLDGMCRTHRRTTQARFTPADRTRNHLNRLVDGGWKLNRVALAAGVGPAVLHKIMAGQDRVSPTTERAILALDPDDARNGRTPTTGPARRIQALLAAGWKIRELTALTSLSARTLQGIANQERDHVDTRTANRIAEVYTAIEWAPARNADHRWGRNQWPLPAEWDGLDIDNPDHHPHQSQPTVSHGVDPVLVDRIHDDINTYGGIETGTRHKIPAADKPAIAAALHQRGHTANIIARALTASHRSINTWTEAA